MGMDMNCKTLTYLFTENSLYIIPSLAVITHDCLSSA